jgi:hypothetical protein
MKSILLFIALFFLTQASNAATPPLTAKQLIQIFMKTPIKDFKAAILKQGFRFDKQTPVPTYQYGQKGNIKDAYRLYFKQGTSTLMLQVLGNDKTNMIYHPDNLSQLKAIKAQVKKMKVTTKRETDVDSLYQIDNNNGIWFTYLTNTIELRNVVFYMDIQIL